MKKLKFVVPGPPVGFKSTTKRSKYNKAYQSYVEYKKTVQLYAKVSGLRLPLKATKDSQLMIRTVAYFKNGTHPDPENVNKGVRDALFYRQKDQRSSRSTGKGDDKHTGGSFPPPRYSDAPRVIVIIKDYVQRKAKKKSKDGKV